MLKKVIKYTDYDGSERTGTYYFNLNKAELMEMQFSIEGGLQQMIEKVIESQDTKRIMEMFKDFILRSYGEKSPDGNRFIKSKELSEAFAQTEAYSELFMELASDEKAATEFFNGIIPAELSQARNNAIKD